MSTRLRNLSTAFACAALTLIHSAVLAGEGAAPQGSGLAVLPFRMASTARGAGDALGLDIQDSLHTALTPILRNKRVTLIERIRLKEVLEENKISDTGLIDPSQAVKLGGKAGARYILLGTITQVETFRDSEAKSKNIPSGILSRIPSLNR